MARSVSPELARMIQEQSKIVRPELVYADNVIIGPRLRRVDPAVVDTLAQSIADIGLQVPITVRLEEQPERQCLFLVAGAHRLAAVKQLGWEQVPAVFIEADDLDVRRWEIAENLHRAELTVLERAEHVREWVRLTEEKQAGKQAVQPEGGCDRQSAQVGPATTTDGRVKSQQQQPRGINAAVQELGITRQEGQRAIAISESLTPEAKAAAVEAKLDDNQSALLTLAKTPADQQVDKVEELAQHRRTAATAPREPDQRKVAAEELVRRLASRFTPDEWSSLIALFSTLKCKLVVEELGRLGTLPTAAHPE